MATAMGIWTRQGKMAAGYSLKTLAMTRPKMARTMVSERIRISRKRSLALGLITRPAMSPTVRPRLRRLTTRAPRSWTAPMKMDPRTTHSRAGSQPQRMAMAGPTMGPVPAMEVKWCPKTTPLPVGT